MSKLPVRIANWFVLMALKISTLFKPIPKSTGGDSTTKTLRVEADVETPLTPGQIAVLLRNLAKDNLHAMTLLSLAEAIEGGSRIAPEGTRGSFVMYGDDMKMDPEASAKALTHLYEQTRRVTREPGNLVEIMVSVVVTSNATTVDPVPITGLSIEYTNMAKDKS